jgi:hypothetical protein
VGGSGGWTTRSSPITSPPGPTSTSPAVPRAAPKCRRLDPGTGPRGTKTQTRMARAAAARRALEVVPLYWIYDSNSTLMEALSCVIEPEWPSIINADPEFTANGDRIEIGCPSLNTRQSPSRWNGMLGPGMSRSVTALDRSSLSFDRDPRMGLFFEFKQS